MVTFPADKSATPLLVHETPRSWLFYWFVVCQMTGGLGSLAVFFTVLVSKRVERHAVWLNFSLTWFFSAMIYSMLYFAGQADGPEPLQSLCLAQASLMYGASVMPGAATLSLVLQLWFSVYCHPSSNDERNNWVTLRTIWLVTWPYVMEVLLFAHAFTIGQQNGAYRGGSRYCFIPPGDLDILSAALTIPLVVISLIFELMVCYNLYRHWRTFRAVQKNTSASIPALVRLLIFSFFALAAVGTSSSFIIQRHRNQAIPEALLALLPLEAFLIFGTQPDILRVWAFWRRAPTSPIRPSETRDSRDSQASWT